MASRATGGAARAVAVISTILLVALASCSSAAAGSRQVRTITSAGESRSYISYRPDSASSSPPLIIALHGGGSTGAGMEGTTHFDTLADSAGFVVAYPDADPDPEFGGKRIWRIGCCSPFYRGKQDITLISDLIAAMHASDGIDVRKVYIVGFSVGAGLAHRAACQLSGQVAAIASVSGYRTVPCKPDRPVSVFEMHGTGDGTYTGVVSTMQSWRDIDQCPAKSAKTVNGAIDDERWNCTGATSVRFETINGGPHCYPVPQNCGMFDASAQIWSFLSGRTLAKPFATAPPDLPTVPRVGNGTPACVVPALAGRSLGTARRRLRAAHCRLGKVVRPAHGGGARLVVSRQAAPAGARVARGSRIGVVLSAGHGSR